MAVPEVSEKETAIVNDAGCIEACPPQDVADSNNKKY